MRHTPPANMANTAAIPVIFIISLTLFHIYVRLKTAFLSIFLEKNAKNERIGLFPAYNII